MFFEFEWCTSEEQILGKFFIYLFIYLCCTLDIFCGIEGVFGIIIFKTYFIIIFILISPQSLVHLQTLLVNLSRSPLSGIKAR